MFKSLCDLGVSAVSVGKCVHQGDNEDTEVGQRGASPESRFGKASVPFIVFCLLVVGTVTLCLAVPPEPGLLFHLSGDHEFTADYAAGGDPRPNYLRDVKIISDGARGPGFECAGTQLLSYWAPGNIYAEHGTLAFFWRSRTPVGPTPFPIFRVGYADHSSWDMVWLRIDYNGRGGFDAFVTDINLARIRVSYVGAAFPKPNEWVHLALSWDETRGIRFFVNGVMAARQDQPAVLYAGLDQFGPHSRIISPMQVQSAYNFIRGGDIDEIRIYDRMLSDANVAGLAQGIAPQQIPAPGRDLKQKQWRDEWYWRYGWNRQGDVPPYLDAATTTVRKVEIHEAYDLKRWWWKATDGIRETTWPGVYNRSRLPGRNDYFQLPDWDCYSLSGRSVTFMMPDESWNHIEISGGAWGPMYLEGAAKKPLFQRPQGQEKTFHRLPVAIRGEKIRFENIEQEEPIGELSVYSVGSGVEPQGSARLTYLVTGNGESSDGNLEAVKQFIAGRYTPDERATVVAIADRTGASSLPFTPGPERGAERRLDYSGNREPLERLTSVNYTADPQARASGKSGGNPDRAGPLPLVHILIPSAGWQTVTDGLDGIAIDLPALSVKPTHGAYFPLNVQVKDPLWLPRNLFDFSFSVKPNETRTLWLDTRDRILPPGKPLYLTIAGAGGDFGPTALAGTRVRLIFKPRVEAAKEHELDRFTQARDSYAMLVEERPTDPRLNLYNRFATDINDVLRVNPNHWLAQAYWFDVDRRHQKPTFIQPPPPAGVPLWAFRQTEQLRNLKRFVLWYIDHRQIENGEFGGGLSDDGDLTNVWPGTALMGCEPEKIRESLLRELEAFYKQGMFTNGLPTIQADDLHSYEEGISVLGQTLTLAYGDPKQMERAMETSRALLKLTGINSAGHRHFRSSYFNSTKMAEEDPWGWTRTSSYLITHPALLLVEYNGNPTLKRLIVEIADGLRAHRRKDAGDRYRLHTTVRFRDDRDEVSPSDRVWPILWTAWRWTGDAGYLEQLKDEGPRGLELINADALDQLNLRPTWSSALAGASSAGPGADASRHLAWQVTGDKRFLEALYASQIEASALREYINTEGSLWIDRVFVPFSELQRARLGGIALIRNSYFPGHSVSWRFQSPATEESTAILVPHATPQSLKIIAFNLSEQSVKATMTAWDLEPGRWEIVQGIDIDGDDVIDGDAVTRTVEWERSSSVELTFTPRATTVLTLKLVTKGVPYWTRPDLGIGSEDVVVQAGKITVTVHSLGGVAALPSKLSLSDKNGKLLSSVALPALRAPVDLLPQTVKVTLPIPRGAEIRGGGVVIDPDASLKEITRMNNRVGL